MSGQERETLEKAWDYASWETGEIKHGTDLRTAFEVGYRAALTVREEPPERKTPTEIKDEIEIEEQP